MKFIQGIVGEERVLLALTHNSMSQHEIATATTTTTKNHIEGSIGKNSICKSPLIFLLSSLLLRLGWSAVSYCGCYIQMTGGEQQEWYKFEKMWQFESKSKVWRENITHYIFRCICKIVKIWHQSSSTVRRGRQNLIRLIWRKRGLLKASKWAHQVAWRE